MSMSESVMLMRRSTAQGIGGASVPPRTRASTPPEAGSSLRDRRRRGRSRARPQSPFPSASVGSRAAAGPRYPRRSLNRCAASWFPFRPPLSQHLRLHSRCRTGPTPDHSWTCQDFPCRTRAVEGDPASSNPPAKVDWVRPRRLPHDDADRGSVRDSHASRAGNRDERLTRVGHRGITAEGARERLQRGTKLVGVGKLALQPPDADDAVALIDERGQRPAARGGVREARDGSLTLAVEHGRTRLLASLRPEPEPDRCPHDGGGHHHSRPRGARPAYRREKDALVNVRNDEVANAAALRVERAPSPVDAVDAAVELIGCTAARDESEEPARARRDHDVE